MLEARSLLVVLRRCLQSRNDRLSVLFYNKMVNRANNNLKRTNRMPVLAKTVSLSKKSFEDVNFTHFQRVNVLNKIFMKSITEIMATGKIDSLFNNKGLQITKVQVAPNFGGVNIFWTSNRSESESLEEYLFEYSKFLRQELISLRVIGYVPQILFIKDKKHDMLTILDEKLQKADFGEDYEPTTIVQLHKDFKLDAKETGRKTVPTQSTKTTTITENLIETDLRVIDDNDTEPMADLPVMTHDIFGLKHDQMLQKVLKSMRKACAFHRTENANENTTDPETGNDPIRDPIEFENKKDENSAFEQFLKTRKTDKIRLYKEKNKSKQQDKDDFDVLLSDNLVNDWDTNNNGDDDDDEDCDDDQFKDTN